MMLPSCSLTRLVNHTSTIKAKHCNKHRSRDRRAIFLPVTCRQQLEHFGMASTVIGPAISLILHHDAKSFARCEVSTRSLLPTDSREDSPP
jgi:hypothetical protein